MSSFYYAIVGDQKVKIGLSADPVGRVMQIQTNIPFKIELVGFVAANCNQEREIHKMLSPWRLLGEWFKLEGPVVNFVDALRGRGVSTVKKITTVPRTGVKLLNYMKEHALTDETLAERMGNGATVRAVRKWKYGETTPRLRELLRLSEITNGAVQHHNFYVQAPSPLPVAS